MCLLPRRSNPTAGVERRRLSLRHEQREDEFERCGVEFSADPRADCAVALVAERTPGALPRSPGDARSRCRRMLVDEPRRGSGDGASQPRDYGSRHGLGARVLRRRWSRAFRAAEGAKAIVPTCSCDTGRGRASEQTSMRRALETGSARCMSQGAARTPGGLGDPPPVDSGEKWLCEKRTPVGTRNSVTCHGFGLRPAGAGRGKDTLPRSIAVFGPVYCGLHSILTPNLLGAARLASVRLVVSCFVGWHRPSFRSCQGQ